MKQIKAKIIENKRMARSFYRMRLGSSYLARESRPGQFIEVRCSNGLNPLLRRPFGVHRITKSGLMLGLGETVPEILETGRHLLSVGVSMMTLGQYLQPTAQSLEVQEYVPPEKFQDLTRKFMSMGFEKVLAGAYVRSSYNARETFSGLGEARTCGNSETCTGI